MSFKNVFSLSAIALLSACVFTGCSSSEDGPTPPPHEEEVSGLYILNEGSYEMNNSTLSLFSQPEGNPGVVVPDIFENNNGRKLGDTGHDFVVYGSKMYVAVYGSGTIEVTDLSGKSIKQIKTDNTGANIQPRYLTTHSGKVYVTLFDGFLARLDTTSLAIEAKIAVGRNPENVVVANNKLYVANSGGMDYNTAIGYDNTVSVVDIASFSETKKIEVVFNPSNMVTDSEGDVYLVSLGNYTLEVPNTLQKIDSQTDEVSSIEIANATEMASVGDKIYMIYSQYDEDIRSQTITYYVYDAITETVITENFISDGTVVAFPYKISADVVSGNVYITNSDYVNNGDIYEFSSAGKLLNKFEVGIGPRKVVAGKL